MGDGIHELIPQLLIMHNKSIKEEMYRLSSIVFVLPNNTSTDRPTI